MEAPLEVAELEPVSAKDGTVSLRCFSLSLNGITVHLSTIGASISKILIPNYSDSSSETDDVVLGYRSPADMVESGNPPYFGVVVGRVANRIAKGKLILEGTSYDLDINNDPNHLHGGLEGFNHKVWDAEIVSVPATGTVPATKGVKFSLVSKDGDQGYPGMLQVSATYTLIPTCSYGAALRLVMDGKLLDNKTTPICMAQHTYFNLAGHDDPQGILQHKLTLPSEYYTPVDSTLIPTREVRSLDSDPSMDWRTGRVVGEALVEYGIEKAALAREEAVKNTHCSRTAPDTAKSGEKSDTPGETYGFDHNYVVRRSAGGSTLDLAATVEYDDKKRRMTVWTDQPGVQLYTGNFLDGTSPDPAVCKGAYKQWQSVCLETQTFPDSISSPEGEFAKGGCHILRPGGPDYHHEVEYRFEPMV